jgi:hypothetical protein
MRKDELLHVHQLLAALRRDIERRGDVDPETVAAYDELSVSPVAAYAQKGDHEEAVTTLAAALAASVRDEGPDDSDDQRQPVAP